MRSTKYRKFSFSGYINGRKALLRTEVKSWITDIQVNDRNWKEKTDLLEITNSILEKLSSYINAGNFNLLERIKLFKLTLLIDWYSTTVFY